MLRNAQHVDDYERRRVAGAWLRRQRERRGLTVRAMGREIGLDSSQVSNYENGKSAIDDRRAARIAQVLEMPEIEVRRQLGLWVPDDRERPISTLEAIEMDPALDDEGRAHFRNQYQLLTSLAEYRRRSGSRVGDPVPIEERVLSESLEEETTSAAESAAEAARSAGRSERPAAG